MIFLLNVFSFVILQFALNYMPYTVHDMTLYTVHDVTLKYFGACKAWMHFYKYALSATNAFLEIKNNFMSQKTILLVLHRNIECSPTEIMKKKNWKS